MVNVRTPPFLRCVITTVGIAVAFCLAIEPAVASQAPIVNALNDGALFSEYMCPGDVGTVDDTIIEPSSSFYVGWWQVNVSSGAPVATWDIMLRIYADEGSGEYLALQYTNDGNRTPNVETTIVFDESPGDGNDTVFYFQPGTTYRLHMYHGGAGSCITANRTLVRSATGDNEPDVQDEGGGNDGITIYGYGEDYYSDWTSYTTSTDPYGFFEAYNSSTYAFDDPDFGWFGNALFDVIKYLFVAPLSSVNDWFQLQLQNARYRSPQGYIVRVQEAWENNLYDSFSSNSSTPLTVNILGRTKTIFAADPEEVTGIDFDEWRLVSTYIFYIMAMLYFVRRASNFIDDLKI